MTLRCIMLSRVAFVSLLVVMVPTLCTIDRAAAQSAQESAVQVERDKFRDGCFPADVDTAIETKADIDVTLKIAHKQSSGQCGCRSAALRALVFAGVGTNQSSGTSLGGKRLVETTPMFSDTLERYALTIKKRRDAPQQHYRIWLSCAS